MRPNREFLTDTTLLPNPSSARTAAVGRASGEEVGGRVDVASRPDATVDRRTRTVPTDPVPVTNRFDHGLPALMVTACEGSA